MTRIAHVTTIDLSLWLLLRTELQADLEAGHEVYGISAPGPYLEELVKMGVRHVPLPSLTRSWELRADLRAARELASALRRVRPDVLHAHTPKAGVLGRVIARTMRVPIVVNTCHGLWLRDGDSALRRAAVISIEALAARFADAELYQNADDEKLMRRWRGKRIAKVVGNGIDLTRFHHDPVAGQAFREQHAIAPDEMVVGTVARRVPEKGLREFELAAAQLANRARFVWIGPHDDGSSRKERIGNVEFLGLHDDMCAAYSALDVFVLASHREGFSRSAMEAAACARALVLTDIRGCREIGEAGVHVRFVPTGNAEVLASTVGELLDDPCQRATLGQRARERALDHFDQRAVARISLETYAEVARRKRVNLR